MFKSPLIVALILCAFTPVLNAQVGIGTTNPKALLHIHANSNVPDNEKGIILPKVTSLPTGTIEKGMFVFLDSNNSNNKEKGIYFYNGSKWEKNDNAWRLGGNKIDDDDDFIGTTNQKHLKFKVDNKQRLKIGSDGDLVYKNSNENELIEISRDGDYLIKNANNNKLIEISKDGNHSIHGSNNNKLIEIKNDGVITLPSTSIDDINSNNKSIATKEYVDTNLASSSGGVLEEITESGTGYRINGSSNGANYGDIGNYATDLSYSSGASSVHGATGDYSFAVGQGVVASGLRSVAMGIGATASGDMSIAIGGTASTASGDYSRSFGSNNTASGYISTAMGYDNTASGGYSTAIGYDNASSGANSVAIGSNLYANAWSEIALGFNNTSIFPYSTSSYNVNDRAFSVGIGSSTSNRKDGIEIYRDGRIYADELDISEITMPKQLVTKEYVDNSLSSASGGGVLEEINEGFTGYRINGSSNGSSYGNIGNYAVDISYSSGSSSTRGATGNYSFAMGYNSTASNHNAIAMGGNNNASDRYTFAVGYQNTASGEYATAIGNLNVASGYNAIAIGEANQATAWNSTAIGYKNETKGRYSFAAGYDNYANSLGEVALGMFNTNFSGSSASHVSTDRIFSIGNGTSGYTNQRADAFEIFKNGTIYADQLEITKITDNRQLVTKEYVDSNDTDDQTATEVRYSNNTSGLSATNVQAAIDELASSGGGSGGGGNTVTVVSGNSINSSHLTSDNSRQTLLITGALADFRSLPVPSADGKIITIIRASSNDIGILNRGNIYLPHLPNHKKIKISQNANPGNYQSSITLVYSSNQRKWFVLSIF